MSFIYGFAGALVFTALLAGGVVLGWFSHKAYARHSKPDLPEVGPKERQKLMEEQQAFELVRNYSTERAYGLTGGDS